MFRKTSALLVLFLTAGCGPSLANQTARRFAYCPKFGAATLLPEDKAQFEKDPEATVRMRLHPDSAFRTLGYTGEVRAETFVAVPLATVSAGAARRQDMSTFLRIFNDVCDAVRPEWLNVEVAQQMIRAENYCANWGHVELDVDDAAAVSRDPHAQLSIRPLVSGSDVLFADGQTGRRERERIAETQTLLDAQPLDRFTAVPADLLVNGHKLDDDTQLWKLRDAACGERWQKHRPKWHALKQNAAKLAGELKSLEARVAAHNRDTLEPLKQKLAVLEKQVADTPAKLEAAHATVVELASELLHVRTVTYSLDGRISSRLPDRVFLVGANAETAQVDEPMLQGLEIPDVAAPGLLADGPALLLDPKPEDIQMGTGLETNGLYFVGLLPAVNAYGQKTSVFAYTHKKPANAKEDDIRKKLHAATIACQSLEEKLRPFEICKVATDRAEVELRNLNQQVQQARTDIEEMLRAASGKQAEVHHCRPGQPDGTRCYQ